MSAPRRLKAVLPQQMRFGFEQQEIEDAVAEMKNHIAGAIAADGALVLDDVVGAFSGGDRRWSRTRTVETLRELIHADHIVFENIGGPVTKHGALRLLLQPAEWKQIRVAHAPLVAGEELAAARELATRMLGTEAPLDQNELCRLWRNRVRGWQSDLAPFKPLADTGRYPGRDSIAEICREAESILPHHDPCRFMAVINERGRRLLDCDSRAAVLRHFYTREIGAWQVLLEALETFEPNRRDLAADPRSQASLATLERTFRDPQPYGKLGNILEHVVAVKRVNDEILERQTVAARGRALPQIRQMISRLTRALDGVNAGPDLRNRTLHPLQAAKKAIQKADSAQAVDGLVSMAADHTDVAMDTIMEKMEE